MKVNGKRFYLKQCCRCKNIFWSIARRGKVCSACNASNNKIIYELTDEEMRKWIKKTKKMKTKRQWKELC